MPRVLEFEFRKKRFQCAIEKVDRSKLYGTREMETLDADGGRCALATLAGDGHTLIPPGGTAIGYIGADGLWVAGDALTAVDRDGKPLPQVPASFDQTITLSKKVTVDAFLEHSIRLTYALDAEGGLDPAFARELDKGAIYTFPFSYRGGVDTDPAFILRGEDGTAWLLIGDPNEIAYVKLEQCAACGPGQEDDDVDEDQVDLDFSML